MYKKLIPLVLLFSSSTFAQVVRDTVWQDQYKYPTTKETATLFTVYTTAKNQKTADIELYNIETKKLIQKGKGIKNSDNTALFYGAVEDYDQNGVKIATSFYLDGVISKMQSTDPRTNEALTMHFEEGIPYNGKVVMPHESAIIFIVAENGIYKDYTIFNPKNTQNKIVYYLDENNAFIGEEYFDPSGVLLYKSTYQGLSVLEGQAVSLNYKNFSISSLLEYVDGEVVKTTNYYASGNVRSTEVVDGGLTTTTYFDQNNQKIASNTTTVVDYESTIDGDVYTYNYDIDYPDLITSIYSYKNGETIKTVNYKVVGDKSFVNDVTYYKNSYPSELKYYNTDGSLKTTLTYKKDSYEPLNGTLEEFDTISIYKDGLIIETKQTYADGKLFKHETLTKSTFYDRNGKVLSTLTLTKDLYDTYIPYQGIKYTLYSDMLYSQEKYNEGVLEYEATYTTVGKKDVITKETFYKNSKAIKAIEYYTNGKKRQEDTYSPNIYMYDPISITYFDKKGKIIGEYNGVVNNGTKYEFFDEDEIKSITKYKNGEITYTKQYGATFSYDLSSLAEAKYHLQHEIDYAKQGKFYDNEGKLLSTVEYKNGNPYNGKVYLVGEYSRTEVNYINGEKSGEESSYSIYDDTLSQVNLYEKGIKIQEENYADGLKLNTYPYKNDQIDGDAIFYDTEGDVLSTLNYVAGQPMSGESITADYAKIKKEVYKNGVIVSTNYYTYEGYTPLMEEVLQEDSIQNRKIYNDEGEVTYQYQLKDGTLDGNYTYFEDGKTKYQAVFKEGKLLSGTVLLTDLNYDTYNYSTDTENEYTVLTVSKKETKVVKINTDTKKTVFEMSAKIKKGEQANNPILANDISPVFLYPSSDYNSDYIY